MVSAQTEEYEVRVRGHLDHHWATWSGCTDLVHHDDGTTTMRTGPVDQSRLHGILARLRDTGAPLVRVEVVRVEVVRVEVVRVEAGGGRAAARRSASDR